jgi:hypothetical protein
VRHFSLQSKTTWSLGASVPKDGEQKMGKYLRTMACKKPTVRSLPNVLRSTSCSLMGPSFSRWHLNSGIVPGCR